MSSRRWGPNVTVAAIIGQEVDGQRRYLLVEEHTPEGLKLNNPAGHLDPAESLVEAAIRETLEETTRVFTPDGLVGIYLSRFQRPARHEDVTYLRFAYSGTVGDANPALTLDRGIVRTLWMTLPEIRQQGTRLRSDLVLTCIEHHAAGVKLPLDAVHADPSLYEPEIKLGR